MKTYDAWMAICQIGLKWHVTQSTHVNFWNDNWIAPNMNIRSLIYGPLNTNEHTLSVANVLVPFCHSNYLNR